MMVAAVLPEREFDATLALELRANRQRRNHAAYLSHRQRRVTRCTQRE
jgi:hypothetical protein